MIPFKEYGFLSLFSPFLLLMLQYCIQYKQKGYIWDIFSLFLYKDHPIISLPSHYGNWRRDEARNVVSGVITHRVKPREFFLFLSLLVSFHFCLSLFFFFFFCQPKKGISDFVFYPLSGEDSHPFNARPLYFFKIIITSCLCLSQCR